MLIPTEGFHDCGSLPPHPPLSPISLCQVERSPDPTVSTVLSVSVGRKFHAMQIGLHALHHFLFYVCNTCTTHSRTRTRIVACFLSLALLPCFTVLAVLRRLRGQAYRCEGELSDIKEAVSADMAVVGSGALQISIPPLMQPLCSH